MEVNFGIGNNVEKQKAKQKKMISQIDARMRSRFLKGTYLPTLNIIISSKDTEQAFLQSYIDTKRENESKTTLIIDEPQWVVRPDKGTPDDPGAFYVAVGNKFLAHELLPVNATEAEVDAYRAKGYSMLKVPPGFREAFEDNIDQALADIAGIAVSSTTRYISGVRLNQAKDDTYQNPFTKDVIEVGNAQEDTLQYANFFDLSRVNPDDLTRPMFIHLDMSMSGDKTGIAGIWITGKRPAQNEEDASRELIYKLAFSVSVKAPRGYQVSFEKNKTFIYWLRSQGFNIKGISMDTFQSASVRQALMSEGFNTQIISVDRVDGQTHICQPYFDLKAALYERRLILYKKCDLLTEELVNLERLSDGHVDHPENGCFTGDTKVSLVDGREVSMVDLVAEYEAGKKNYVYSFNETSKKIEPKLIERAWCTKKDADLVLVELDNGEQLKCTENHMFMLRTGEYRAVAELTTGDALMPLYRRYPTGIGYMQNYRQYYEPIEDTWHYEHRQFASEVLDEKYLVHHKNCNRDDNSPTNLIWCSKCAHQKIHAELQTGAQSLEANNKRKATLRAYYNDQNNSEIISARNLKISNTLKQKYPKKEETIKLERQREQKHKEIEALFNVNWTTLTDAEKDSYSVKYFWLTHPETIKQMSKSISMCHKAGNYENADTALKQSNYESAIAKQLVPVVDTEKFKQIFGFYLEELPAKNRPPYIVKYRKIVAKTILNHKVVKVIKLSEKADVYDLTIADNHNFALSAGIFVHNSKDQADAVCGAMYLASKFANEYAYSYGENLDTSLAVSGDDDDLLTNKQKMMASFEEELKRIYQELSESHSVIDHQAREDYNMYKDIADGIICP